MIHRRGTAKLSLLGGHSRYNSAARVFTAKDRNELFLLRRALFAAGRLGRSFLTRGRSSASGCLRRVMSSNLLTHPGRYVILDPACCLGIADPHSGQNGNNIAGRLSQLLSKFMYSDLSQINYLHVLYV
jgi:hypothetical protein